eukprot:364480-Chlamydomonas_euryale.AAC.20
MLPGGLRPDMLSGGRWRKGPDARRNLKMPSITMGDLLRNWSHGTNRAEAAGKVSHANGSLYTAPAPRSLGRSKYTASVHCINILVRTSTARCGTTRHRPLAPPFLLIFLFPSQPLLPS